MTCNDSTKRSTITIDINITSKIDLSLKNIIVKIVVIPQNFPTILEQLSVSIHPLKLDRPASLRTICTYSFASLDLVAPF